MSIGGEVVAITAEKTIVSFPVSVWFVPETGNIHLARRTDDGFVATLSPNPLSGCCHPLLYEALSDALRRSGAQHPLPGVGMR